MKRNEDGCPQAIPTPLGDGGRVRGKGRKDED